MPRSKAPWSELTPDEKILQKKGMNLDSETTQRVLKSIYPTVKQFKAKFRTGWTEFTDVHEDMTVREAIHNRAGNSRKLMIDQREKFTGGKGKGKGGKGKGRGS